MTLGLVVLGAALVGLEVALVLNRSGRTLRDTEITLPVPEVPFPGFAAVAAVVVLAAAVLVLSASLETAAAMQVLARDTGVPRLRPPSPLRLPPGQWPERVVPDAESLPPGTRLRCTVLVPAHNEEAVLGTALTSIAAQTRAVQRVVVIADNCTDRTVAVARAHEVEVVETSGNTEKKAGALNQVLARMLPASVVADVFLVMDADSTISDRFVEVALDLLEDDPSLTAVGGLFYGEEGGGLVGQLQRNEYTRYQRLVARRRDRVFVLTGTASIIRGYALDAVARSRGELLPGPPGRVYDTLALTEDNELTLALKTLGARLTSPPECRVTTEVMTTWRDLGRQRLRWHRGAVENIGAYGLTRATAMYWGQQLGLAYGVVALHSFLALTLITLLAAETLRWSPFWVTLGLVFVVERIVTVWRAGRRARLLAAPVFIELGYAFVLQWCFVVGLLQIATGRRAGWNYVPRPAFSSVGTGGSPLLVASGTGLLLPVAVLYTDWYLALSYWVAFNTLVFAALTVFHLLPPLRHQPAGTRVR